jgi:1,4-alpha-glucan branching enzyme
VSRKHNGDKVIVFDRGGASSPATSLVFVFNFHPSQSFTDYRVGVPFEGDWKPIFTSDAATYGGHGRIDSATSHVATTGHFDERPASILAYLPSRCCVVFAHASSGFEAIS